MFYFYSSQDPSIIDYSSQDSNPLDFSKGNRDIPPTTPIVSTTPQQQQQYHQDENNNRGNQNQPSLPQIGISSVATPNGICNNGNGTNITSTTKSNIEDMIETNEIATTSHFPGSSTALTNCNKQHQQQQLILQQQQQHQMQQPMLTPPGAIVNGKSILNQKLTSGLKSVKFKINNNGINDLIKKRCDLGGIYESPPLPVTSTPLSSSVSSGMGIASVDNIKLNGDNDEREIPNPDYTKVSTSYNIL